MARYPSSPFRRQRNRIRNRILTILAVLIVGGVIAVIYAYRPFEGSTASEKAVGEVAGGEGSGLEEQAVAPEPALEPEPNLPKVAPAPVAEPGPEAAKLIEQAMAALEAKPSRIIEARDMLNRALREPMNGQQRQFIKDKLSELADKWLFSRRIFPEDRLCGIYKVKPGDQLRVIGGEFKVPHEILAEINYIRRAEALRSGEAIKVIHGPFNAKVYRSSFTMDLYLQNTFVRSFQVGLGKPGMETPTGLWAVKPGGKLKRPAWTNPITGERFEPDDPDYPLGSRWIGLDGLKGEAEGRTGFAIHGTKKPEEIGTAKSQGCIRLDNGDVILVYNLLEPVHSLVEVVD
jgi:hypothetical protein